MHALARTAQLSSTNYSTLPKQPHGEHVLQAGIMEACYGHHRKHIRAISVRGKEELAEEIFSLKTRFNSLKDENV
jgi:hypothetical protein